MGVQYSGGLKLDVEANHSFIFMSRRGRQLGTCNLQPRRCNKACCCRLHLRSPGRVLSAPVGAGLVRMLLLKLVGKSGNFTC